MPGDCPFDQAELGRGSPILASRDLLHGGRPSDRAPRGLCGTADPTAAGGGCAERRSDLCTQSVPPYPLYLPYLSSDLHQRGTRLPRLVYPISGG